MPEEKEVVMDVPVRKTRKHRKHRAVEEAKSTLVTKTSAPVVVAAPPVAKALVAKPATVVIAPAKKKPVKVMLVAKDKQTRLPRTTFKVKQVRVTIDNTAKTQKQRRRVLGKIDAMSEDAVRAASVAAKLSRRETVAKVPIGLLRQMLKDYQTMKHPSG